MEPAIEVESDGARILIDSAHEILVNKLTALLARSELRDLVDLEALLASGGDLARALRDAPAKDSGFSPLTIAWVLRELPIQAMAKPLGVPAAEIDRLVRFRENLIDRILALAKPQ